MKKIFFISLILLLITGCGTLGGNNVLKNFTNTIEKSESYYLEGTMEIVNNEDVYTYDVMVSYKEDDYYKVDLINTSNDHEQIILRNDDGVYVVTPNLNKSFKFQSDWPYNNSQVYLLGSIVKDINGDEEYTVEEVDGGYILTSKVNYPNNANLVKQMVYLDGKLNINKVEVVDTYDVVQIRMIFSKVDLDYDFVDNYFNLNQIINVKDDNTNDSNTDNETDDSKETVTIDDIIYPMYLPSNTYLTEQETLNTDNGQRLILTFDGDSSFVLIEEVSSYSDDNLILPVNGDIDFVSDVLAVVSDNSISWSSGGIDYYMVSSTLDSGELLQIARSISALPVSK